VTDPRQSTTPESGEPDRRPAAFLDRDGTLNRDEGYIHRPEDLVWNPGAKAAVKRLNEAGWRVIVCTNQSGIARGLFDEAAMHAFHAAMQAELAREGARIDAFYFSPYHVDGVIPAYAIPHQDRKPNPGMLIRAMADWPTDRARSFMIGDREDDVLAAAAAGVKGYRYRGGSLLAVVEQALAEAG
jgi:D-glycero-D-manno-heptose 1,7-bisphosphate phosphatase